MDHRLIFVLAKKDRIKYHRYLVDENYATWSSCGVVVCFFQLIMLMLNVSSGVVTERTLCYRYFYIALIVITVFNEFILARLRNYDRVILLFYVFIWLYMLVLSLWAIGITYIGFQYSQDLSTYAYTVIAASALILLEPWSVVLNTVFSTVLLNILLSANPEYHYGVRVIIQTGSICLLAIMVELVGFNRRIRRIRLEYEQVVNMEEIRKLNEQLRYDAVMDALTGVYNRRFLTGHIDDRLNTGELCSGALMVDIDCFKKLNDTYGHQTGDECLMLVGRSIRGIVDDASGYAVRYGGEEFLIYYYHITEEELVERARQLLEQLRKSRVRSGEKEIALTVSIGYSMAAQDMTYGELIEIADENLYEAKAHGRDRIWPT